MLSCRHWSKRILRFGLALVCVVMLPLGTFAQANARPAGKVMLPSGHEVSVISTSMPQTNRAKNPAIAKITLSASATKSLTPQRAADEFFNYVWGPQAESLDALRARVLVSSKDGASGTQTFAYSRKGPGLWLPDGRELPDWLKQTKPQNVALANGQAVWLEAKRQAFLTMAGRTVPQYDLTLDGGLVGLNRIVTAANAFLATRAKAPHAKAPRAKSPSSRTQLVSLNLFGSPRKTGFHFRPLTRFWQVVPKSGKPWLLVKFQKSFVMASKAFVLIMTYVPTGPFAGIKPAELQVEADRLMAELGRTRAEKLGARFVSIIALWPAASPRARPKGFSTVFTRKPDGTWTRSTK